MSYDWEVAERKDALVTDRDQKFEERRRNAPVVAELERVIERMEDLGRLAEDAQARVTDAIPSCQRAAPELVEALGDVIEIVTERTQLAHEARRLVLRLRDSS